MRSTMGWITGIALLGFATGNTSAETIGPQFDDAKFISHVSCLTDCSGCSGACGCSGGCDAGCSGDCGGTGCSSGCGCAGGLGGCSGGIGGCGCGDGLFSNIDVGGWVAWGWYDNSHGLSEYSPGGNTPLGFNNISGEPVLNQAWVYMGKEAETGKGFDWGFRCDFMFGADGPDTSAFGDGSWDTSWTTSGQYAFAMPQLYGEVALGDTLVKFGHFFTIIGYEVVQAPDNFFYSHVYTMFYNEPFTHTGVLAQRSFLDDDITLYGGWTAGWDTGFDNRNDGSVFLGGIGMQLTEKTAVTYATVIGDPGDGPTTTDAYMHSLVFDTAITDKLNHVLQADFQTRTPDPAAGDAFKQYGIVNYLLRQVTDCLGVGLRYEWFYVGENAGPPLGPATLTPGVHYHAWTLGANYKPRENIIIKPEIRGDYIDFDGMIGGVPISGGPFDRGTARSQFTYGLQSILTY